MKTTKLSNKDVQAMTQDIIRHMTLINYIPDYVVGVTRGGLVPALLISQYYDKPMNTIRVSLRDHPETECNAWMPEDAFGYKDRAYNSVDRKNILIVDDINDTGATIEWIKRDWESSCFPNERKEWDSIWHNNVKFATLISNEASSQSVDFCAKFINTVNEPEWTIFPWEKWWK